MRVVALFSSFALLAVLACQDSAVGPQALENSGSSLTISGNGQRVTGHVNLPVFNFPGLSIRERYSFNALRHPDGTVTGEWQVADKFDPLGEFAFHGDVTCFTIASDNKTAWLGGIVERDPGFGTTGLDANWTVVDNGEGNKAPPDQATDLTFGVPTGMAAVHCATGNGTTSIPPVNIVGGNVQVIP